jgi:hypothetical protein
LQVDKIFAVKSLEQLAPQETSLPGGTQSASAPSHFMVPQVPEPPQELRGVVTALQAPGVCLQDWHLPVHALLQHTPSAMNPLVHSFELVAGDPSDLRAWHLPVAVLQ